MSASQFNQCFSSCQRGPLCPGGSLGGGLKTMLAAGILVFAPLSTVLADTDVPADNSSTSSDVDSAAQPAKYSLTPNEMRSLGFSADFVRLRGEEQRTGFQFRLSPGKFDFSLAGGFGLGAVFANPEFELSNSSVDRYAIDEHLPQIHEGLSYSAGIQIEHENAHISDTAYVSSGQLGVNYGRMGRVWYNGVDVIFEQSAADLVDGGQFKNETVSFDLTAGRRLGLTGVGADDPFWLLSLRGDFDIEDEAGSSVGEVTREGDWFLNPSLFWDRPGFRFAAHLELPLGEDVLRDLEDFEPPDYKLRAVIEKSFK